MTTWRKDRAVHGVITDWHGGISSPLDAMDTAVEAYKRWLAGEIEKLRPGIPRDHLDEIYDRALRKVLALLESEDKP